EKVTENVFDNRSSDDENSIFNDRFKKGKGYHAVPPPLTGNYMPPKSDLSFAGLDDSIYNFKINETVTSLTKDEKDAPDTSTAYVEKPKEDRSSAPFIQDWDINSDNDSAFRPEHIHAKIDFVKADRMAKKSVLPSNVGKGTGHKESRPAWNNVQRINHQNKFAPTAVFTRQRVNEIDQISKDNRWICTRVDYGHPHQALKNKEIVDSGCSRHMTGNKADPYICH
nr:hypothetical protein [Tanacetum cinerariifolium]